MISFKDSSLLHHQNPIEDPSVSINFGPNFSLSLKFNSKDILIASSYSGPTDIWMASMCELIKGKHLTEVLNLSLKDWEEAFREDQLFWDLKSELDNNCYFVPVEILKAAINIYRGRDYLYKDMDALICRCFGVREKEILNYLQVSDAPDLAGLSSATKAGMGCRSCIPQIKRWLSATDENKRFYKNKPIAEWLLEIDHALQDFPQTNEWKLEVMSFKKNQVIISFDKEVNQEDEEKLSGKLQGFLASVVDSDLGFFLIRERHS